MDGNSPSRTELSLVARGLFLDEIYSGDYSHSAPTNEDRVCLEPSRYESYITRWHSVFDQDRNEFERRIAWDSISLRRFKSILEDGVSRSRLLQDDWVQLVLHIHQSSHGLLNHYAKESSDLLQQCTSIPFADILLPLVGVATHWNSSSGISVADCFAESRLISRDAFNDLKIWLLRRLSTVASTVLYHEFSSRHSVGENLLSRVLCSSGTDLPKEKYQAFAELIVADSYNLIISRYPVLARLVASIMLYWISYSINLHNRFQADSREIARLLNIKTQTGADVVERIHLGLSDCHNKGNSVSIIQCYGGSRIVYKPRPIAIESAFSSFLARCDSLLKENHQAIEEDKETLRSPCLIDKGDYGWVEYIQHIDCDTDDLASRFYRRFGMLLAILHALGASDFHYENIINSKDYPILVDIETIIVPKLSSEIRNSVPTSSIGDLDDSVLLTGVLPIWFLDSDSKEPFNFSGMRMTVEQESSMDGEAWVNVNSDFMRPNTVTEKGTRGKQVSKAANFKMSPTRFIKQVTCGFEQMYNILVDNHADLVRVFASDLELNGIQLRFIIRPTQTYAWMLGYCLRPDSLQCGIDYSIDLDLLARVHTRESMKPDTWNLLKSEQVQLQRFDVPYFQMIADSSNLYDDLGKEFIGILGSSPIEAIQRRLKTLNANSLALQIKLIHLSINSYDAKRHVEPQILTRTNAPGTSDSCHSEEVEVGEHFGYAKDFAQDILFNLHANCILANDGIPSWVGLSFNERLGKYRPERIGYGLYEGLLGVAIFLAAGYACLGHQESKQLAVNIVKSFGQSLNSTVSSGDASKSLQEYNLGIASGIGGFLYSYVTISRLLGESCLIDDAAKILDLIPHDLSESSEFGRVDILDGMSGLLIGLVCLCECTPNKSLLELVERYSLHLLDSLERIYFSESSNNALPRQKQTGFAHGATGIAYALSRVYNLNQDPRVIPAINKLLDFEDHLYSPTLQNWPIIPQQSSARPHVFWNTWCYGSPGISMARMAIRDYLGSSLVCIRHLEEAVQATTKMPILAIDHLCCGSFGIVEILFKVAQEYPSYYSRKEVLTRCSAILQRTGSAACFRLFAAEPGIDFSPSLFKGSAGIGYQLLRLNFPDILPSLLLFQ
jgi:type 2 lantibiotic biosynthesis protein LanM